MLTVDQAFEKLLATVTPLNVIETPLDEAFGLTLGEDIVSSVDSPPFDKSLMDGYALRSADLVNGIDSFRVIEVVTAGRVPNRSVGPGEAAQIMTGAPLPVGADLVVKIEETRRQGELVSITSPVQSVGKNISRQGSSVKRGDCVFRAGVTLNGPRIGALAELGRHTVAVHPRPRVGILTTGDELVPIEQMPGPGQIRNSNEFMLAAQVQAAGASAVQLGIARDDRSDLCEKIFRGLTYDILVMSGGVSAGTLDLVPSALAESGVREVFHKVEMKPGKPIWFGTRAAAQEPGCYVFGLPGNPVSSLVCFELFVRTAIKRMMGIEPCLPQPTSARLEHDYFAKSDRPTYHPARLTQTADGVAVTLVAWHGSSDLCGTANANGMAYLPGEERQYRAGDRLDIFAW